MPNNTSPHILSTAANLLGFCLFVITSLHISDKTEGYYIDELTSIVAVFFAFSCIFSFVSIRTKNLRREKWLEMIADYFFIIGLVGILITIILIALNFIK